MGYVKVMAFFFGTVFAVFGLSFFILMLGSWQSLLALAVAICGGWMMKGVVWTS